MNSYKKAFNLSVLKILLVYLIFIFSFYFLEVRFDIQATNFYYPEKIKDLLSVFTAWDARFYWYIAENGYQHPIAPAFYPLYPTAIKLFNWFLPTPFVALFLSNIFFLIGIYFFFKLVAEYFNQNIAFFSVIILLLFPTSFYFSCIYSESLFFCLAVSIFYCLKKERYALAVLCSILIGLCRPMGVLLVLPVFFHLWTKRNDIKIARLIFLTMAPVIGFIATQVIMYFMTGDIFASFKSQNPFVAQNSIANIFSLHEWFLNNFVNIDLQLHGLANSIVDRVVFLCFVVLLFFSWKVLPREMFFYLLLLGLIPALSGRFMSYSRLILVCFPMFIVVAVYIDRLKNWKPGLKYFFYVLASLVLLFQIYVISLYARNYWVA